LHAALPTNAKLLEQFDELRKQQQEDCKKKALDDTLHAARPTILEQFERKQQQEDCKKKALAFIELAQRVLVLNQPASSGLDQEIRDLITQQYVRSWPFWMVIVLWLSLCGALFGVDWYYAGKAREIIANMQRQLDGARAQIFEKTSELNKITKPSISRS